MTVKETCLYFKGGSSDKVYHVELRGGPKWYEVHYAHGRRNGPMTVGTKTAQPLALPLAERVYDKLVASKKAKGYVEGPKEEGYEPPAQAVSVTGVQLLNAIELTQAQRLLKDDEWWMQEKKDGKRMTLTTRDSIVPVAMNRSGKPCGMPAGIQRELMKLQSYDFVLDGECVGDAFWAFDLLRVQGADLMGDSYFKRYLLLEELLRSTSPKGIAIVQAYTEHVVKQRAFNALRKGGAEGVVFKRKAAKYVAGRPASGGDQLKFKFWETATVIATPNTDRSSFDMAVIAEGKPVAVGSCTVPPNKAMPKDGDLCEVRYLYAYPGGSLYQPTFLENRTDELELADVTLLRDLKFKG